MINHVRRYCINSNFWKINPSSCNGNLCINDCWSNNDCGRRGVCLGAQSSPSKEPKPGRCSPCILFCKI